MFKLAKLLRDIRLFVYIAIIAFQIRIFLTVGTEIINGNTNETTLYKVVSFAWATLALLALKAMCDMWDALEDVTDDIRKLKEKGHLEEVKEPSAPFGQRPKHNVVEFVEHDDMATMSLIERILQRKNNNEPSN